MIMGMIPTSPSQVSLEASNFVETEVMSSMKFTNRDGTALHGGVKSGVKIYLGENRQGENFSI